MKFILPPSTALAAVVEWLEENVGKRKDTSITGITSMLGDGWIVTVEFVEDPYAQVTTDLVWSVVIFDERHAVIFALRWL